jgi:aminoglycoside 6'-N-acetyltransferase I
MAMAISLDDRRPAPELGRVIAAGSMQTTMMRVRAYQDSDWGEWLRMSRALLPGASVEDDEAEMRTCRARSDAEVFVVERPEGSLAGYVEVATRPYADGCSTSPVGYIEAWYVDPDVRRQGFGRALLAAAETWARERGYREMASDALLDNDVSFRAHARAGYGEVDRVVQFRKSLNDVGTSRGVVTVRAASQADRPFVLGLVPRLRAFGPSSLRAVGALDGAERRTLERALGESRPDAALLVAEHELVGPAGVAYVETATDYFTGERHGHLAILIVTEEGEGRGVGRALLATIEAWSVARDYRLLTLNVFATNARARDVYERAGYVPDTMRYVKELGR